MASLLPRLEPPCVPLKDVPAVCGVSRMTIFAARRDGTFPPPAYTVGARTHKYRLADLRRWCRQRQRRKTQARHLAARPIP